MSHWEQAIGESDDWLTPFYVFEALGELFDMDVAHPRSRTNVPCLEYMSEDALTSSWRGFVWMNPPFGGRNGIWPWMRKFFEHGNGVGLGPDRTSAPWCQDSMRKASSLLFVSPKIKFERLNGTAGCWPSSGTILFAVGDRADQALLRAEKRGLGVTKR
jgi:hypothetical protein